MLWKKVNVMQLGCPEQGTNLPTTTPSEHVMSVPLLEKGSLNLQLSLPSLQQIMEHCIALSLRIRMSLDGLWDIGVRVIQGIHRGWTLTPHRNGHLKQDLRWRVVRNARRLWLRSA